MSFVDQYNSMPDVATPTGGKSTAAPKQQVQSQTKAKSPGLFSKLSSGLLQMPEYFGKNLETLGKVGVDEISGNKQAAAQAAQADRSNLGLNKNNNNVGNALKRLAGNSVQLGATIAAPETKGLGIGDKIVASAKTGAMIGTGSALANNQNLIKGAVEGGLVGGTVPIAAKVAGKLLPGSVSNDLEAAGQNREGLVSSAKSNLNNHLQQMEATSGGFNAGAKLPGSGPDGISLPESQALSKLSQKYNIPAGAPSTRLRSISSQLNTAGQEIDQKLQANNAPLSDEDKQAIMGEFQNKIDELPPTTSNRGDVQQIATQLKQHFMGTGGIVDDNGHTLTPEEVQQLGVQGQGQVKDLVSMNQYRRNLDQQINFNRSSQTPDPASEQVASAMRNTLSDQLNKHAPEVAGANKTYSELKALESPTLAENQRMSQGSGGIVNRALNNSVTRGIENKVSNAGQQLTGGIAANTGEAAPIAGSLPDTATSEIQDASPVPTNTSNGKLSNLLSSSKQPVMNGVDQLTPTRIPVTMISDEFSGKSIPDYAQKLFVNDSEGYQQALQELKSKGYLITDSSGRTSLVPSTGLGDNPIPTRQNVQNLSGNRTSIPLTQTGESTTSTQSLPSPVTPHTISSPPVSDIQPGNAGAALSKNASSLYNAIKQNSSINSPIDQKLATLAGANAAGGTNSTPTDNTPTQSPDTTTGSDLSSLTGTDTTGTDSTDTTASQSPFTEQQLLEAINADPTHGSTYIALYKELNPTSATSTTLDATQQKEITAGEAAINGIQQYADQINQYTGGANGNVATGKLSVLLGKTPLGSSADKQAASLESNRRELAIQVATSLSGGTKPSAASVAEIENSLPSVNDTAQVREDKVNDFVQRMKSNLQIYATPVSQLSSGL